MKYIFTIVLVLISLATNAQLESPSDSSTAAQSTTIFVSHKANPNDSYKIVNSSQENNTKATTFTIHRDGKKLDATLIVVYLKGKVLEVYITEPTMISVVDKREYFKYRLPIMLSR